MDKAVARLRAYRYHAALIVAVVLVFFPAFHAQVYGGKTIPDFLAHVHFTEQLRDQWSGLDLVLRAYMGWQQVLFFWHGLFGLDFEAASVLSVVLCEMALALVVFRWFAPLVAGHRLSPGKAVALTLGLLTVAPIAFLWPADHLLYLGYLSPTSYHNPSIVLLRPFALVQFGLACALLGGTRFSAGRIAATAVVSLLATFAKPNFAICLLPALGLLSFLRLVRGQDQDLRGLVLGIVVPVVAVLAWQFVVAYILDEKSGIAFMPLVVMRGYSDHLALKFLASTLFPVLVGALYFRRALADLRMVLAWTIFALGAGYTYLLAETGERLTHGNFGWCAEIALFILFVVTMAFHLEAPPLSRGRMLAIRLAWGLHVAFGVAYYFYCLLDKGFF